MRLPERDVTCIVKFVYLLTLIHKISTEPEAVPLAIKLT